LNLEVVSFILGRLSLACGSVLVLPLLAAFFYQEPSIRAFGVSIFICLGLGMFLCRLGRLETEHLSVREGIAITGIGWIMVTFLGMVPYAAGGYLKVLDGVFETISGLSGTGATVIDSLETLPHSILLWRSLTHWFGGLGIIVIFIALLPQFGRGAVYMFNAESTGPTSDRVLPRIKSMAMALFAVYLVFTVAAAAVYMLCGMNFLDAVDHSFSTIATGGFSNYDASIAHFNNPVLEGWIIFFMVISSANFGMYVMAWRHGWHIIWENTEFKTYLFLVLATTAAVTIDLFMNSNLPAATSFRYAIFQTASLSSTTGFVSADFDVWPSFSKLCLMMLMFVGGCAGSTAGGLKVSRLIILIKAMYSIVWQKLHPQMVPHVHLDGVAYTADVLLGVGRFFFAYLMLDVLWALLLIADGVPVLDSIGISVSTMGSVGPAFGMAGPTCTYSGLPDFSKVVVCFSMLLGRLETFTILVMLNPEFWHRKKW